MRGLGFRVTEKKKKSYRYMIQLNQGVSIELEVSG